MSNLKRFMLDRLSIVALCLVINIVCLVFSLYEAFIVWLLALIATIFLAEKEVLFLLFEKRKAPITKRLKALDDLSGMRVIIARHESWFIRWRFEDENGTCITLLDPTVICKKTLIERIDQLKNKQFTVQYYKHSKLIVSM